jgi:hypothetical protein
MHLTQLLALVLVLASHTKIAGEFQLLHAALLSSCASQGAWPLDCCHLCCMACGISCRCLGK